jgi:hypothetical protein
VHVPKEGGGSIPFASGYRMSARELVRLDVFPMLYCVIQGTLLPKALVVEIEVEMERERSYLGSRDIPSFSLGNN